MLVLQHGFREAGEDLNMVAAILVLKDDLYLKYKNSNSGRDLLCKCILLSWPTQGRLTSPCPVTEDERGSLWRTDIQFPDWAWTLTENQIFSYDNVRTQITRLAKLDGFDLEFVMLIGPDNFTNQHALIKDYGYSDKWLISTAARAPEDYSSLSGPPKISNCTIWSPVTPQREKTTPKTHSLSWLYPDKPTPSPKAPPPTTQIWECHVHGDPNVSARYLYTLPALHDTSATELVSATAIHAAISTTTKTESSAYIDEFALGPIYLKQQLGRRDDGNHQAEQNLRAAEEKLRHLAFEDIVAGKLDEEDRACGCREYGNGRHEEYCGYHPDQVARILQEEAWAREDAADEAFPFCFEGTILGKRHAGPTSKSPQREKKDDESKNTEHSEDEQKSEDEELPFEDTMRLRVPMKKEKISVHKAEYGNANCWLAA
jgi:hypothetical protein